MHLAVLFEFPTLNGGERSLLAVVDELRRQGNATEFTALAPPAGPLADALAQRAIRHIPWSVRDSEGTRRPTEELEISLKENIQSLRPDLVHANSLAMGRLLGRIADRVEVPSTAHLRDIIGLSAAAIADLNRNTQLIAISEATRTYHAAQGLDAARTVVIYNGIDLDEFQPRPATGWLHRELQIPPQARLIAAIGQIGLRKGWDVLAEAAIPVAAHHPDVHFLLIGARHSDKAESRQYEAGLKQRFIAAGLENQVHWLGERDDVRRILNEIDLLVHPAKQEPLGRVLLEGLTSGVPMVATDVGGTREIIESDISGQLVPPGDSDLLADAISDVLSNQTLAQRFRHEARQQAKRKFDIKTSARKLEECWRKQLLRHDASSPLPRCGGEG